MSNKGHNCITIMWQIEPLLIIREHAAREMMYENYWVVRELLTKDEGFKTELIEKYGQETYDNLLKHWNKTILQIQKENKLEEEKRAEQAKLREDLELKMLELRTKTSEAYVKNAETGEMKAEIREAEFEKIKAEEAKQRALKEQRWAKLEEEYPTAYDHQVKDIEKALNNLGYPEEKWVVLKAKRAENDRLAAELERMRKEQGTQIFKALDEPEAPAATI